MALNSLRSKYTVLLCSIVLLVSTALTTCLLVDFRRASYEIWKDNSQKISTRLYESAELLVGTLSAQLTANLINPVYYLDMKNIRELLEVAASYPEIVGAVVFNHKGVLLHDGTPYVREFGETINLGQQQLERLLKGEVLLDRQNNLIEHYQPIMLGDTVIGILTLSYSLELVNFTIAELQDFTKAKFRNRFNSILANALVILLAGLLLGGLLVWFSIGLIKQPIKQLAGVAKGFAEGDFSHRVHLKRKDELGRLSLELNHMADKLETRTRSIHQLAFQDSLTGLPNRRFFRESLKKTLAQASQTGEIFAVLFIDLDGFKRINDTLGHDCGDQVLKELASRIKAILRGADVLAKAKADIETETAERDPVLARLGGDEFILLLRDLSCATDASLVAKRLINCLNRPISLSEHSVSVGCSIGISVYPNDSSSDLELMRYADLAMYNVKSTGKNNYRFYSHNMPVRIEAEKAIDH